MSSSTLYRIYHTKVTAVQTYRNSGGTAMTLWGYLAEHYLGQHVFALDDKQPLWDLSMDPRVPSCWRMTLEFTFDRWVCPPALLPTLADACRDVGMVLAGWKPEWVNHWPLLATHLWAEAHRRDTRWLGVGLGCTSVCDPWEEWRPQTDPVYLMEDPLPEWR